MRLNDAQLRRYNEDGFLVIDRLADDETVTGLRQAYEDVLDGRVTASGDRLLGDEIRQVMRPSKAHPVFDRNAALEAATEIAHQVVRDAARSFDMLIYKPPGHAEVTPWHQDMAYAGRPFAPAGIDITQWVLQVWIALDDVDEENGCMQFLPGYHTQPLREHYVASGDPDDDSRLLALVHPEQQVDLRRVVAAPLQAGGATIHSPGTPHYTGPNRSTDRPRRAYIINFVNAALLAAYARPNTATARQQLL